MPSVEKVPILIVDDRQENLTALGALLDSSDLTPALALSGNEALRCTLRTDFALVLLDVQMPGMDGFETAELMRANPRTRNLPIIFITAGMKEDLQKFKGYETGAVDYLIKPIDPAMLRAKVKVFSDLYRQRRNLEARERDLEDLVERRTEALRASEARLRTVTDHAPGAILQVGPGGRILFSNRPEGEGRWDLAVGSDWLAQVPEDQRDRVADLLRQVLMTGKGGETEIGGPAGRQQYRCRLNRVEGKETCILFLTDITAQKDQEEHRRRLEAEVTQAQKMESLGSLASGVAHDMNNVLAAILTMTQTLQQRPGLGPEWLKDLATIEKASLRGRSLVKGLTNFVRKGLDEAESLDLNALVRQEMELLSRTTLQKVQLAMDLQEDLPKVWGEPGSLGSALMNLCVNSVDAMPDGGTLRIATRTTADTRVELSIEDSGCGMPPDVLDRAMEPFFTTKPIGKGTGLGLAMVYATMKTHGGTVGIRSEPEHGTTVILRLPAHRGEEIPPVVAKPVSPPEGSTLKILLVDDDDLIRASVPYLLESMGHAVLTSSGGEEALRILASGSGTDLVILDLNMPGMSGAETFRQLRAHWPDLPVLMATGFLDPATESLLKDGGRARSIAKPFMMDDLHSVIAEMAAQFLTRTE